MIADKPVMKLLKTIIIEILGEYFKNFRFCEVGMSNLDSLNDSWKLKTAFLSVIISNLFIKSSVDIDSHF